ncbi:hypothetical protein [Litorilinea aerophila]|nr:hypothetical protein [Litorilinea aerophila]
MGFRQEGRLRRMIYTGGQFHDVLLLGLTAEEFREHHRNMLQCDC